MPEQNTNINWDNTTKILHWLLAITMVFQLILGLLIHKSYFFFDLHQIGGIAAIAVLIIEWMWIFATGQFGYFFAWDKKGMAASWKDITNIQNKVLPPGGPVKGLSNFWHGLGLIIFSLMGITGLLLLFNLPQHSIIGVKTQNFMLATRLSLIHVYISYAAWIYIIGHVIAAIIHQISGDKLLQRTFLLTKDSN